MLVQWLQLLAQQRSGTGADSGRTSRRVEASEELRRGFGAGSALGSWAGWAVGIAAVGLGSGIVPPKSVTPTHKEATEALG